MNDTSFLISRVLPLPAQWLVSLCNNLTSPEGPAIVKKGWEKAGIMAALEGKTSLPGEDPKLYVIFFFLQLLVLMQRPTHFLVIQNM